MGHLSFMKEEYRKLHGRLMKGPVGVPLPENPEAREAMYEIFRILFSPEDALLASRMPFMPSTASRIAQLLGLPVEKVKSRLEEMSSRGLVVDVLSPKTGEARYALAPPVVGFFEFSMMRRREDIPQKKLAEALDRYVHLDPAFMHELAGETTIGRALVHEDALDEEVSTEVLSYEKATEIIKGARAGAVATCYCRHKAEHLDKACDVPQDICTTLNAGAEWAIRRGFSREASTSEMLEHLAKARELGLVQMGDNVRHSPTFICHCCACCCEVLTGISRHGVSGVIKTSNYILEIDHASCSGCGRCARACPVQAISLHASPHECQPKGTLSARVDEDLCLGCGVCVRSCPKAALRMKQRPVRVFTPESTMARIVDQFIERGRLQHLLFETAARPTLLRRALAAIMSLPPGRQLLASKQARSRFLKEAASRVKGM